MSDREREERNRLIREMGALGFSRTEIAEAAACSPTTVFEILNPERQRAYNERRLEHYHRLRAVA